FRSQGVEDGCGGLTHVAAQSLFGGQDQGLGRSVGMDRGECSQSAAAQRGDEDGVVTVTRVMLGGLRPRRVDRGRQGGDRLRLTQAGEEGLAYIFEGSQAAQ